VLVAVTPWVRLALDHVRPRKTIVTHGLRAALDAFEDHLA
jgi:hypothetical protein